MNLEIYEIIGKNLLRIAAVGARSWGTAVGTWLARNGHTVRVWDFDQRIVEDVNEYSRNYRYLPDI